MTVTTNQTRMGETRVNIRMGIRDFNIYFKTRADAVQLLKALRKRAR